MANREVYKSIMDKGLTDPKKMRSAFFKPVAPSAQSGRRGGGTSVSLQQKAARGTAKSPTSNFEALAAQMLSPGNLSAGVGRNFTRDERAARIGSRRIQNQRIIADMASNLAAVGTKEASATSRAGAANRLSRRNTLDQINSAQALQSGKITADEADQQREFEFEQGKTTSANTRADTLAKRKREQERRQQALTYRLGGGTPQGAAAIADTNQYFGPNYDAITPLPAETKSKGFEYIPGTDMPDPNDPLKTIQAPGGTFNKDTGEIDYTRGLTNEELVQLMQGLR